MTAAIWCYLSWVWAFRRHVLCNVFIQRIHTFLLLSRF